MVSNEAKTGVLDFLINSNGPLPPNRVKLVLVTNASSKGENQQVQVDSTGGKPESCSVFLVCPAEDQSR